MKVQASAWKDHANAWEDSANFWKSRYRHQNCFSQKLENANKSLRAIKETRRTNNADRGFTSDSRNVVTPGGNRREEISTAGEQGRKADDGSWGKRIKVAQKDLGTARAQNCVAQANATKYPVDASAALAAEEANEREVQMAHPAGDLTSVA
ncbi:hypothetical protein K3495_g7253 [Podosphaera aphanis]|nr:hypothetical protein K3495_g7253 [Podosphaera aphanis]